MLSGSFPVLQFSTIDLEKRLDELSMKFQWHRMEGEYKMFMSHYQREINPRMLLKAFTPVSKYYFSREIVPYLKESVV